MFWYKRTMQPVLLLIIAGCVQATATAQNESMVGMPQRSYSKYFRFFLKNNAHNPVGSDMSSKGIMALGFNRSYEMLGAGSEFALENGATGFLIRTFRNDKKICMCTAAHVVAKMPAENSYVTFDAYMKYLGEENPSQPKYTRLISGYKSTLHAKVLATIAASANEGDAALLLVDQDELPLADIATLGYSFDNTYNSTSRFYAMGHPYSMPQRLADSLLIDPAGGALLTAFTMAGTGSMNNTMSKGASGGPVVYKGNGDGGWVTGIYTGNTRRNDIPIGETDSWDLFKWGKMTYSNSGLIAARMSVLKDAIKIHCWQSKTEQELLNSNEYKQTLVKDNTQELNEFAHSTSITNNQQLDNVKDPNYSGCGGCILVKAGTLNISCVITPSSNNERIYGLAESINLLPGFSYTSDRDYPELGLNTVVLEPRQAAAFSSTLPLQADDRPAAATMPVTYSIKPNPSTTGIFELAVTGTEKPYMLNISSMDGKPVLQKTIHPSSAITIDLSGKAHGIYLLQLYDNNKIAYQEKLVY